MQFTARVDRQTTMTPLSSKIPDVFNPAEEHYIVVYLTTMIGNKSAEDLRNLLCFVTGASVSK